MDDVDRTIIIIVFAGLIIVILLGYTVFRQLIYGI